MALKATIFKAELTVSDLDRHRYATHSLTIARHPSETDERMMVRLLAFALHADERLAFGRGLGTEGEADLVLADLTGAIELWVDIGLPDEREVRKAAGKARRVAVVAYGGRAAALWWEKCRGSLERLENLHVCEIPEESSRALALQAGRKMQIDCTIQEGAVWLSSGGETLAIHPRILLP